MFLLQSTCEKLYRNAGVFKVNAKEYQRSIVITLRYSFKTKLKLIFTGPNNTKVTLLRQNDIIIRLVGMLTESHKQACDLKHLFTSFSTRPR